ncbi:MAG: phage tail tape measure protein [Bulleidia sp.]
MSAKRIKGITIEIDGSTKGLDKSLADVDRHLKTTKDDLKDVNKLLKLDPKNTELLKQKQVLLKTAIGDTKDRLSQLKTALAQMDASGADKNSEAYRGLQREIAATEGDLKKLEKQARSFGSVGVSQVQAVGKEVQKLGDKVSGTGESLTKNVTTPIAAIGGASIAAFQAVDAGMDAVVTKTGATGEALASMQAIVEDLATSLPVSFGEAGNAVGEVNTRFGVTGDKLKELSAQFLKFAQINGTDVIPSIDGAQKAMDAWGLSSDDAGAFLDTLNAVGQKTGVSMDTLEALLVTNATAFQGLGLSVADAASLLGELEKSGIDVQTVMTGLSKAQAKAAKEGVSLSDELQKAFTSARSAVDILGKTAGPKLFDFVQNSTSGLAMFSGSAATLEDNIGSVSKTFDNTRDPIDQWRLTLNQLQLTGAKVGSTLGTVLKPILENLSDSLEALAEWWDQLDPGMREFIVKTLLIVAAIGPLLIIIGKVISAIGAMMAFFNPITLAIAGIVAGIAAVIAIIQNWGTICEWFQGIWEGLVDFVGGLLTVLGDSFSSAFQSISEKATGVWELLANSTFEKFESIKTTVKDAIEKLKGFFNFEWKLPKIKLPHFSITGSFSLDPPSIPHFGVEWYAKGGILTAPTIFGMQNSALLGGGEAGPEAVLPIELLKKYISDEMDRHDTSGDFNQTVIIKSPQELSPSEIARQTRNATRSVLAAMRGNL